MTKTIIQIQNKQLTAKICTLGAELISLQTPDGQETIWQADSAYWNQHAPILFPVIGELKDSTYSLRGRTFNMPLHGFAMQMEFECIQQTNESVTFRITDSPQTRQRYPFLFSLEVMYRLEGNRLMVCFSVETLNNSMPFSIGAHPGFNLPGPLETCFLEFDTAETLDARLLNADSLLSDQSSRILTDERRLMLTKDLFNSGALMLLERKSDVITLGSTTTSNRISVDCTGFPHLGLWSLPGAPYVCIEPWFGYPDPAKPYGEFDKKPGSIIVGKSSPFHCTHSIEICSA